MVDIATVLRPLWSDDQLVPSEWPSRLLHIPSMTSVIKEEGNVYHCEKEPNYGILTYTWGRWQAKHEQPGERITVHGCPWAIPRIKTEHFRASDFQKLIDFIGTQKYQGRQLEFVWIDIACIDQENNAAKLLEVGRQVGIFQRACRVYIWLNRIAITDLTRCMDQIYKSGMDLTAHAHYAHSYPERLTVSLPNCIKSLTDHFTMLFGDPWFSSLWTLQESILRHDALILSREVEAAPLGYYEGYWSLTILINTCQNIHYDLDRMLHSPELARPGAATIVKAQALILTLEKAGYAFLHTTNPNVQYGLAQYRQTKHPLDRIYAIMQIYGLRLGGTKAEVSPASSFTLQDLQDEFGKSLNEYSPILAQMFIHSRTPEPGRSWRISEFSKVPDPLLWYREPKVLCQISITPAKQARLMGHLSSYNDLIQMWERDRTDGQGTLHDVTLLDEIDIVFDRLPRDVNQLETGSNKRIGGRVTPHAHGKNISRAFGNDNLHVFLMGTLSAGEDPDVVQHIGILLLRSSTENILRFRRLGVCMWRQLAGTTFDFLDWKEFDSTIE